MVFHVSEDIKYVLEVLAKLMIILYLLFASEPVSHLGMVI